MTGSTRGSRADASTSRRAVLDSPSAGADRRGRVDRLLYDAAADRARRAHRARNGWRSPCSRRWGGSGRLVGPRRSSWPARWAWTIVVLHGRRRGRRLARGRRSRAARSYAATSRSALLLHQGGLPRRAGRLPRHRRTACRPPRSGRSPGCVAWGTPALAVPLLIAQALDEPAPATYEAKALVECLTFVLAATLGLALATGRQHRSHRRLRRGTATGSGSPIAAVVGARRHRGAAAAFLVGPIVRLVVAIACRWCCSERWSRVSARTITLRAIGIVAVVGLAIFALSRLALDFAQNPQATTSPPVASGANAQDPTATVISWLPIIALALVAIVLLVRRWLRRRPTTPPAGVSEERWTEPAGDSLVLRRRLRLPWSRRDRSAPSDAVGAYLAALADMDRVPALARTRTETPAAHARRLRAEGVGRSRTGPAGGRLPAGTVRRDDVVGRGGTPRGRPLAPAPRADRRVTGWPARLLADTGDP